MYRIETAAPDRRREILDLLTAAQLPTAGAEDHLEHFFIARDGGRLVGSIGLEIHGDVGLLRSLAVAAQARGGGLGEQLVARLIEYARGRELRSIYLLTTTAEHYFPRFGFEPIPREAADPRLGASLEFQGVCPDSAACLRLEL